MRYDYVVAVDIGKRESGLALFDANGELLTAFEVYVARGRRYTPDPKRMARRLYDSFFTHLVLLDLRISGQEVLWAVEKMVDYEGKGARERDLDHLRKSVEELQTLVDETIGADLEQVKAHAWKGGVTKEVTEYRVRGILSEDEFERVDPWTKETWDAIGIGLFKVGRAARGTVPKAQ